MPFAKGNNLAKGGKRVGAGRKVGSNLKACEDFSSPQKVKEWLGAVQVLATSAESEKVQLAAYQELLNRALGKPTQHSDVKVKGTVSGGMTDEEMMAAAKELGFALPPGLEKKE